MHALAQYLVPQRYPEALGLVRGSFAPTHPRRWPPYPPFRDPRSALVATPKSLTSASMLPTTIASTASSRSCVGCVCPWPALRKEISHAPPLAWDRSAWDPDPGRRPLLGTCL